MNDAIVQQCLHCDYLAVPQVVREWIPEERIRLLLRREWEKNTKRITDTDFAESFQERCPVPDAIASDYSYRLLELAGGRHVLTSIRFKGLDMQKPFVEILHKSFVLESADQARTLAREIAQHYSVFAPRRIRIFDSSGVLDHPGAAEFTAGDLRYYAAPMHVLRLLPLPPRFGEVALERLTDLDFYDTYAAMYEHLYAESPHLRVVPVESRQTMTDYLNEGKLYGIVIGGRFAGVVGVLPQEERFLSGLLVVEEILDRPFRGRGFAVAIQRRLLEEMSDSSGMLYGHISPINTASLRTASRVGRRDVGGMYFVEAEKEM